MTAPTPERPLDVEALRRLEAGASPTPWIAEHDEGVDAWDIWLGPERGGIVANVISNISDGPGFGDRGKANAELIAALRNQLPAILAALSELEGLTSAATDAELAEYDDLAVVNRRLMRELAELEGLRAENEELHVQVVGKAFESEQMHAAANSARAALEDGRPDIALSMLRSALAAHEAEEER